MPSPGEMALARGAANDLQQDTCTIVRRTRGALDEGTGKYPIVETRIYPPVIDPDDPDESETGPCRLKQAETARAVRIDAAGQELVETAYVVSLPIGTSLGVQKDDVVKYASSRYDPHLVGKEFRIAGPHHQTHASARRFAVEETT